MKKFAALPKGTIGKAVAVIGIAILPGAAGATQLPVTNQTDNSGEQVAETEEITDKSHPQYVKCRSEPIIGSLARKRKICLTNEQWAEARKSGNRMAHEMVNTIQSMSGGSSVSSGK